MLGKELTRALGDWRVLGEREPSDSCSLSFWSLETEQDPTGRCVYAWLIPSASPVTREWSINNPKFEDVADRRSRLRRTTIVLETTRASSLLEMLWEGGDIGTVCEAIGLPPPPILTGATFSKEAHTLLLPAFLRTHASLESVSSFSRGRASPSSDDGGYCLRICGSRTNEMLFDGQDDLLKWTLQTMEKETGINFTGSGAEAVGNLEIFSFPTMTRERKSRVEVRRDPTGTTEVAITGGARRFEYLVQVRSAILHDVVFDEVDSAKGDPPIARFEVPEPTDGLAIRIWRREPSGRSWMLWHESEQHYLREVHAQLNIGGLSGKIGSAWLDRLVGSRAEARAEKLREVRQVSITTPIVSSTRAPWEVSIQRAREASRRLYPERSGARFFPKGWEGDSKLSFAEWLREQLSETTNVALLMDPYFDTAGLELVCRASGVAKEIMVLTCTQQGSAASVEVRARARRLLSACHRVAAIVSGIRLTLLDTYSAGGGSKQRFHDRYLLFYDSNGTAEKGFHLSNSLQAATVKNPLLVTPIPADILPAVGSYAHELLEPNPKEAIVERLYPPQPSQTRRSGASMIPAQTARSILRYASILHDAADYRGEDGAQRLVELGFLRGQKLTLGNDGAGLSRVGVFLGQAPLKDASDVWCGFAETCVRTRPDGHLLATFAREQQGCLRDFLPRYLRAIPEGSVHVGKPTTSFSIVSRYAHLLGQDFASSLKDASALLTHHHEMPVATTWPIFVATRAAVKYVTDVVDDLIIDLATQNEQAEEVLDAVVSAATTYTREGDQSLLRSLAKAQTPLFRALSAIKVSWRLLEAEVSREKFRGHLQLYSSDEQRAILARAIFELGVGRHVSEPAGSQGLADLSRFLFDELVEAVDERADKESTVDLIRAITGGSPRHNAASTQENLLLPVVSRRILTDDEIHEIWCGILNEKLESGDTFFYPHTDAELMLVWGLAYWLASSKTREATLEHLRDEVDRAVRVIREPFLPKRDYERWQRSADTLLWWVLRLASAARTCDDDIRLREIESDVARATNLLEEENLVAAAIGEMRPAVEEALTVLHDARQTQGR